MRRVWVWIRQHLALRRLTRAEQRYRRWRQDVERLSSSMERHRRRLRAVERKLASIGDSLVEDLEESKVVLDRQSEVVDMLNAELEILKELTVPGLTAANQLMLERYEALSAIEVHRQMAFMPDRQEG